MSEKSLKEILRQNIVEHHLKGALPRSEIRKMMGRRISDAWFNKLWREIVKELGADYKRPAVLRKNGFAKLSDEKPLSPIHHAVGVKLDNFRNISKGMGPEAFCVHYKFSNMQQIRRLEMGQVDFTLSELLRIAEIINQPLEELVKPFTAGSPNAPPT